MFWPSLLPPVSLAFICAFPIHVRHRMESALRAKLGPRLLNVVVQSSSRAGPCLDEDGPLRCIRFAMSACRRSRQGGFEERRAASGVSSVHGFWRGGARMRPEE
ncbi:hypothetical protein C8Q74DRAFT_1274404 [Fomes fomentarius]|nr:hypothetical protein C8Q74DRAFT_1274404 [Fomes fomentarius]